MYCIHGKDLVKRFKMTSKVGYPQVSCIYPALCSSLDDHNVDLYSHPYSAMIAAAAGINQLPRPCNASR